MTSTVDRSAVATWTASARAPFEDLPGERLDAVDALVGRAARAAEAFRALDQEEVDAIVEAMVRAGVRAAPELAALAIGETGFGVFADKVVKNYGWAPSSPRSLGSGASSTLVSYVAPDEYAQLGRVVFGGRAGEESRRRLFQGVEDLLERLGMPRSLAETAVPREEFEAVLPDLRMPLLVEITSLLRAGYEGRSPDAD